MQDAYPSLFRLLSFLPIHASHYFELKLFIFKNVVDCLEATHSVHNVILCSSFSQIAPHVASQSSQSQLYIFFQKVCYFQRAATLCTPPTNTCVSLPIHTYPPLIFIQSQQSHGDEIYLKDTLLFWRQPIYALLLQLCLAISLSTTIILIQSLQSHLRANNFLK